MILVDVQIPALDRTYDFELDEETPVGELVEKIAQLIREKARMPPETEKLCLYAFFKEKVLNEKLSLHQQGIETGEKLLLM